MTRCRVCNRILKSKESVDKLIGPTCDRRLHPTQKAYIVTRHADISEIDELRQLKLFEEEVK